MRDATLADAVRAALKCRHNILWAEGMCQHRKGLADALASHDTGHENDYMIGADIRPGSPQSENECPACIGPDCPVCGGDEPIAAKEGR